MDYVASDELGNLVRLGIVLEVHFTYAVHWQSVHILPYFLDTFSSPSMMYATAGPG